jgi:hypothetical protein
MATFFFNPTTEEPKKQAVIHAMLLGRGIEPLYKECGTLNGKTMFQIYCDTDKMDLANEVLNSTANHFQYKEGEMPVDTENQAALNRHFERMTGQPYPNNA